MAFLLVAGRFIGLASSGALGACSSPVLVFSDDVDGPATEGTGGDPPEASRRLAGLAPVPEVPGLPDVRTGSDVPEVGFKAG